MLALVMGWNPNRYQPKWKYLISWLNTKKKKKNRPIYSTYYSMNLKGFVNICISLKLFKCKHCRWCKCAKMCFTFFVHIHVIEMNLVGFFLDIIGLLIHLEVSWLHIFNKQSPQQEFSQAYLQKKWLSCH